MLSLLEQENLKHESQTLGLSTVTANSSTGVISWIHIVKAQKKNGATTSGAKISNTAVTLAVSTANSEELNK